MTTIASATQSKDKSKQVSVLSEDEQDDYRNTSGDYCTAVTTSNSIAITCEGDSTTDYAIPTSRPDTSGYCAAAIATTAVIGPTNLDSRTHDALGTFAVLARALSPPIPRQVRLLFHTGCNVNDSPKLHTSVWRTTHYSYDHISRVVVLGPIPDGHGYRHYDIRHDLTYSKDSTRQHEIYTECLFENEWILDSSLHALICIATSSVYTAGSPFDYDKSPDLVYDFISSLRLLPCTPVCYEFKFATSFGAYQIWKSADDIAPKRILIFDVFLCSRLVLTLRSSSYRKHSMYRDIMDHTQTWILGEDILTCVQATLSYKADRRYRCSLNSSPTHAWTVHYRHYIAHSVVPRQITSLYFCILAD